MEKKLLAESEKIQEYILMGLRLKTGIDIKIFSLYFNKNLGDMINLQNLKILIDGGLMVENSDFLCVTDKGRLVLNKIIEYIALN